MPFLSRLKAVDEGNKEKAIKQLVEDATPDFDFFMMLTLSVLMASFGLLAGSETIVIGSMLIAPLLHPVLGVALGLSMSDHKLMVRSVETIGKGILFGLGSGILATLLFSFGNFSSSTNEAILSRTEPSLLFLMIAVISGVAVTYALVRPELSETLPGVAISVALVPPLAVIGIGIARFDLEVMAGAAVMFIVNIIGIVAASMFIFSVMDVHGKRHVVHKVIEKEERRVEREEKEVEKIAQEST